MTRSPSMNGALYALLCLCLMSSQTVEARVEIASEGWTLIGDLVTPDNRMPHAFVLLLHKAAGDRSAYTVMAEALASRPCVSICVGTEKVRISGRLIQISVDTWMRTTQRSSVTSN